jgi:hypothetical protein
MDDKPGRLLIQVQVFPEMVHPEIGSPGIWMCNPFGGPETIHPPGVYINGLGGEASMQQAAKEEQAYMFHERNLVV